MADRLIAGAPGYERADRLDLAVHALAQLPEAWSASVSVADGDSRSLRQLGDAYGLGARLELTSAPPPDLKGVRLFTSGSNLERDHLGRRGEPASSSLNLRTLVPIQL